MKDKKKSTGILILLSVIYIPLLLITLFIVEFSGIDDSCKFLDLTGVSAISSTPCISRTGDLFFDIGLIILNLFFIVPIIKMILDISKIEEEEQKEEQGR